MASPRKHPSRYPSRLTDLLLGPSITLDLPTPLDAINLRYQLYSFRESLRSHPHYNTELLAHANSASFKLRGSTLRIAKPLPTTNHKELHNDPSVHAS